ncbi:MAG: heavy-metal-associated domain-containing protein [Aquificae bacterium]|nr:heavy-metal-associated domain-containing protein [Aquificota bacterium]
MENLLVIGSSILLIGGISWFFFGKKEKGKPENLNEEDYQTIEVNITGMHCAGCAAGIEGTFKSMDGIKEVQVNFATSKGRFVFNPVVISKEQVIQKIKELGYDASIDLEKLEKKS